MPTAALVPSRLKGATHLPGNTDLWGWYLLVEPSRSGASSRASSTRRSISARTQLQAVRGVDPRYHHDS